MVDDVRDGGVGCEGFGAGREGFGRGGSRRGGGGAFRRHGGVGGVYVSRARSELLALSEVLMKLLCTVLYTLAAALVPASVT